MKTTFSTDARVVAALLLAGFTSGSAFLLVKLLVSDLAPFQVVTGRLVTGAMAVFGVMLISGSRPAFTPRLLGRVGVLALLDSVIPYTLVSFASVQIDSSIAAILISTMPMFTLLFAIAAKQDEAVSPVTLGGLSVGFIGVITLASPDLVDFQRTNALALVAVLISSASYAAGAVYAKKLLSGGDPVSITGIKLGLASFLAIPVMLGVDGGEAFARLDIAGWSALIALGFGSTGLSRCVYLWVIAEAGSVKASLITYIVPVVALALGWSVLGESVDAQRLVSTGLILSGVASVMYGPKVFAPSPALRPREA